MQTLPEKIKNSFTIIAITIAYSLLFLNESGAIAVTFPQMQQDLNLSNTAINWVMNGFLLTAAVLLLLGGKLADNYGRRKIFCIGMLIFLLASALCASSQNNWMIIVGRVLQAIGASMVYPSGSALINLCFTKENFGKAYGTIIGFAYFFVALGPFVGGLFTDFLNWRWIFWVNVPTSIICLLLTLWVIPKEIIHNKPPRLDWLGLIVLMSGLGTLVFALMQGGSLGWSNIWTLGLFAMAIIGLVLFVIVELNTNNPLLQIRLFHNKAYMAGNVIFPCVAACFTALVVWAIWLQEAFNFSPIMTGIAMIPATCISLFMLRISGAWGSKVGPRKPMLLGACLLVTGIYWIAVSAQYRNYPLLFWGFLFFGFGTPLIIPNSISTIMQSIKPELSGIAAGTYLTLQHVAFSLGFAILSAVMLTVNNKLLYELLQSSSDYDGITPHQVTVLLAGKNIIPQLSSHKLLALKQAALTIYTHAFSYGMAMLGIFAVIALTFTYLFIPRKLLT